MHSQRMITFAWSKCFAFWRIQDVFHSTTQGLVRNAAALSNWTHFCAQSLAANVQQVEIETKFLGFGDLVSVSMFFLFPVHDEDVSEQQAEVFFQTFSHHCFAEPTKERE